MDLFEEIVKMRRAGQRGALATIVHTNGSIPSYESSRMLVREDGSLVGTGGGHVSMAMAKVASSAGFAIGVVDDREAFANLQRFPMAQEVFISYEQAFEKIQPNSSTYLVIVTRGHKEDMRVLAWAARTEA